jgi:ribonuclease HII
MPDLSLEISLQQRGARVIAGIDEAGRGALVGPVSAAAVILPSGYVGAGLDDSKKLSRSKRESLYEPLTLKSAGQSPLRARKRWIESMCCALPISPCAELLQGFLSSQITASSMGCASSTSRSCMMALSKGTGFLSPSRRRASSPRSHATV